MKEHISQFKYTEVNISEVNQNDTTLINKAIEAANNAYAPYSNFKVGAACLLEDGNVILGSNQENAAYPSGLCAERVALFHANSNFKGINVLKLVLVAINKNNNITEVPVSPCGACRQVFKEISENQENDFEIILAGKNKVFYIKESNNLLPLGFDNSFL